MNKIMKKSVLSLNCFLLILLLVFVSCFVSCTGVTNPIESNSEEEMTNTEPETELPSESQSESESTIDPSSQKITYQFSSEEKGFAGGLVTVRTTAESLVTLYWGDENEQILEGYSYLAKGISDEDGMAVIQLADSAYIPESAVCLIALCGESLDVESLVYQIPQEKLLKNQSVQSIFGAISDVHIGIRYDEDGELPRGRFLTALDTLSSLGADFVAIAGDITCASGATSAMTELWDYADCIEEFHESWSDVAVYTCSGNHECIFPFNESRFIKYTQTQHDVTYTGGLHRDYYDGDLVDFTVSYGDNVTFIFLSQRYTEYTKPSDDPGILLKEQLVWLENRLEENKDKTVFLFFHTFLKGKAGDPSTPYYECSAPYNPDDSDEQVFSSLLGKYQNVIFCSGHSHTPFESMFLDSAPDRDSNLNINFMASDDYAALVHIPGLAACRQLFLSEETSYIDNTEMSEGYLVKIYENYVVFLGYDFVHGEYLSYANYIVKR